MDDRPDAWYYTAEVCLNGHVTNEQVELSPEVSRKFCDKCGEATITECPSCHVKIRGAYHVKGVLVVGRDKTLAPNYCHNCGKAYTWTEKKLKAAKELADELEGLDRVEKDNLKASLDDIVRDTPSTQVAATKFVRIMAKAGKGTAKVLRQLVVDIASETAKKIILQGQGR